MLVASSSGGLCGVHQPTCKLVVRLISMGAGSRQGVHRSLGNSLWSSLFCAPKPDKLVFTPPKMVGNVSC